MVAQDQSSQILDLEDSHASLSELLGVPLLIRAYSTGEGEFGTHMILDIVIEDSGEALESPTSSETIQEQVTAHFEKHPQSVLRAAVQSRVSKTGKTYHKLVKARQRNGNGSPPPAAAD